MSVMQLEKIFLDHIEFKLNLELLENKGDISEMSLNLEVFSTHNPETRASTVTVAVSIPAEPTNPEQPFMLKAAFSGFFKFDENFSKENLEYFQNVNCPAIIFPYLRESVADIVRRAGLPALHLPPFNFVALYKKDAEKPKKRIPAAKARKTKPKADSEP